MANSPRKEYRMSNYQKVFKRTEKKYLVTDLQYRALMNAIGGYLEPDKFGQTEILNIYYDTPDFRLIRTSLEKPVYKEKLRLRSYGVPAADDKAFIELKKKYKGVVYKRRIDAPYAEALRYLNAGSSVKPMLNARQKDNTLQIMKEINYFMSMYPGIGPAMALSYDRLAYNWVSAEDNTAADVNASSSVETLSCYKPAIRITADTNIRYRRSQLDLRYGAKGTELLEPGMHLIEIKLEGGMPLELSRALNELEIYPTSFSKYGRAYQATLARGEIDPAHAWIPDADTENGKWSMNAALAAGQNVAAAANKVLTAVAWQN